MTFRSLGDYLETLRRRGLLVVVDAEVDANLEVPEIHRRVIAAGGPALLFRRVRGAGFPLATNLFGTRERVELAFGPEPRRLVETLAASPERLMPPSPGRLFRERGFLMRLARTGVARRRRGPVTQHRQSPPDLERVPITTSWPGDGGPFLTLSLVYTQHPRTGVSNLGVYRMQRLGKDALAVHWQIGKGGGFHHAEAEAREESLPVNVFLGGPPALILGAVAPLPENVPELLLASYLQGRRMPMVDTREGPLPVAAEAEMCLVGEVRPGERVPEGPFGDHYGYYSLQHPYPVFRCRSVLHRPGAVIPATVVGKPRQEDSFLGDFVQELLAPLFPLAMPGVRDLWSYGETGYHALAAAVVRERYRREAMASAFRILGEGQLSLTKFLLVTDQAVDLRDFRRVLPHVLERADPRTDLYLLGNLSMDTLDYAGPRVNEGGKGVLLGLGEPRRELPAAFTGELPGGIGEARAYCPGCLVVDGPPAAADPGLPGRLAGAPQIAEWPLVVLVDDAPKAASSTIRFLWTAFTRFNPAADLHAAGRDVVHNHLSHRPPLVLDARLKPGYPPELLPDPETEERVTRRWGEYFPGGGVPAGDSAMGHLGG